MNFRGVPFEDNLRAPDPLLSGVAADPPERPCREPSIHRPASQYRPKSIERLHPHVNPIEPRAGKLHNSAYRYSVAGRTISKPSQYLGLQDNEECRPTVCWEPWERPQKGFSECDPFETGKRKNSGAPLPSIERCV